MNYETFDLAGMPAARRPDSHVPLDGHDHGRALLSGAGGAGSHADVILYQNCLRAAYAGGHALRSPCLSPLFGDFSGFPPTLIQVGDHEILYSDSAAPE